MTDSDYTHIAFLVDQSGSMFSIKTDTEGAVNQFITDQREVGGHATLTMVTFDTRVTLVHDKITLADAPTFELHPSGMTALLDAIGTTIKSTGDWLSTLDEDKRPGKVIFVIMTDGLENSSKEYTPEAVAAATQLQAETYGWEFNYLGANQDAIAVARDLGIAQDFTVTYSGEHVANAVGAASASVTRSRTGGDRSYTEAERSAAVGG